MHAKALAYDEEGGTFEATTRAALPREPDLGFYVDCGVGVLGMYASPAGPVLFRDALRVPLDGDTRLEVTKGRRRNTFTAWRGGEELLAVSYAPPTDVGIDVWSDEALVDFYVWLANSFPTERFLRFYTTAA